KVSSSSHPPPRPSPPDPPPRHVPRLPAARKAPGRRRPPPPPRPPDQPPPPGPGAGVMALRLPEPLRLDRLGMPARLPEPALPVRGGPGAQRVGEAPRQVAPAVVAQLPARELAKVRQGGDETLIVAVGVEHDQVQVGRHDDEG